MAVIFTKKSRQKTPRKIIEAETAFTKWYKTHRDKFNERRRARYQADADYRQRVQESSKRTRISQKKPRAEGERYCISLAAAAEDMGVTVWTLRHWRQQGYFPEPFQDQEGLWFTVNQLELLRRLNHYFVTWNIKRLSAKQRAEVEKIAQEIHASWRL